ncbi:Hypp2932 [Branchiostoma lanceolatum]|uniref:Hypp2932 protein n=1 Tax=Branchiostoma lanceolatum TaxID=7740 RepID=A0A8K0EVL9_BRALA|nr:Hypp2932 [Branchiostoma lanceolatum]
MSMGRGFMAVAVVGGTCIAGYGILAAITPSRESMLQKCPEKHPVTMLESRQRSASVMATLKYAAETDQAAWNDKFWHDQKKSQKQD